MYLPRRTIRIARMSIKAKRGLLSECVLDVKTFCLLSRRPLWSTVHRRTEVGVEYGVRYNSCDSTRLNLITFRVDPRQVSQGFRHSDPVQPNGNQAGAFRYSPNGRVAQLLLHPGLIHGVFRENHDHGICRPEPFLEQAIYEAVASFDLPLIQPWPNTQMGEGAAEWCNELFLVLACVRQKDHRRIGFDHVRKHATGTGSGQRRSYAA